MGAEGLFDPARKQPIPYLPQVIGVVTSPSGAVIRDILHRLRDRFARHVLIWPVAVQGQDCAAQVAAAIKLAKRPVLYCGGGVISANASDELRICCPPCQSISNSISRPSSIAF